MKYFVSSSTFWLVAIVVVSTTNADQDSDSTHQLSVALSNEVKYPNDRPAWVSDQIHLESRIHTLTVKTIPCDSYDEAESHLKILKLASVQSYIRLLCKAEDVEFYEINQDWIDNELVVKKYEGDVTVGDDSMVEQAVLLEFTPKVQAKIRKGWKNTMLRERVSGLGVMASTGVAGLVFASVLLGFLSRRHERSTVAA